MLVILKYLNQKSAMVGKDWPTIPRSIGHENFGQEPWLNSEVRSYIKSACLSYTKPTTFAQFFNNLIKLT
jgi:hypothetical protein